MAIEIALGIIGAFLILIGLGVAAQILVQMMAGIVWILGELLNIAWRGVQQCHQ